VDREAIHLRANVWASACGRVLVLLLSARLSSAFLHAPAPAVALVSRRAASLPRPRPTVVAASKDGHCPPHVGSLAPGAGTDSHACQLQLTHHPAGGRSEG
jgi:hypothetical protein